MADINHVKDASGYTIDDYKRMYNEAKAAGDASAMQAANKAANAIREQNDPSQIAWATQDIANTAAKQNSGSGYTTINQNLHNGTDTDKSQYRDTLLNTIDYANKNPDATKAFTQEEFNQLYGNVQSPTAQGYTIGQMYDIGANGQYTYDAAEANYAASQGYTVQQTTYNGKPAYMITPNENTSRPKYSGTSGADEDLLNSQQYAAVQYEKQQWNKYNELYNQVKDTNPTLAQQYLSQRDQAHTNAERIRAGAWLGSYSGGADGSTYLTYGALSEPDIYNFTQAKPYTGENAYANAIGQTQHQQAAPSTPVVRPSVGGTSSGLINGGSTEKTPETDAGNVNTGGNDQGTGTNTGTATQPTVTVPTLEIPQMPTADSLQGQITDYSDYIKEMMAAKQESALAALESAYLKNTAAIDRAGAGIGTAYQDARNQTAGASELSARNFNEMAAAMGLNTGATGQAELSRNVTLQNNLNSINTQEAQTLADLDLQRSNVETDYNTAISQAMAENSYQEAQMIMQEKIRVEGAILDAMQQEFNNAVTQYQLQYQSLRDSVSDSQWQKQFDLAYQQWQSDVALQQQQIAMQKESLAMQQKQLEAEIAMQQQQIAMQQQQLDANLAYQQAELEALLAANQGSVNGGSVGSGTSDVDSLYQMMEQYYGGNYNDGSYTPTYSPTTQTPTSTGTGYNNGGLTTAQVKELQNYFNLTADGFWGPNSQATTGFANAKLALENYQAEQSGTGNGTAYTGAVAKARIMQEQGATNQEIFAMLDAYSPSQLTNKGMNSILSVLKIGGY